MQKYQIAAMSTANWQAGIHTLKLAHAYEEHEQLNIEVRHVATYIRDEDINFELHITCVEAPDPPLTAEL